MLEVFVRERERETERERERDREREAVRNMRSVASPAAILLSKFLKKTFL